jgi:serine/threonine-protein kinase
VSTEPPELAEGQRLLDRYVIIDKIAAGGMATIYRALDERLDRVVCVKLLREDLAPDGGSTAGRREYRATYQHFLKEALALSRLQHPNTLRIYDFGYLPDTPRPFQISEFCDGGNLEQYVRARGALDHSEVLTILDAVTGALAEAHEKGIVHRDVKPSNILFGRVAGNMIAKLADFGIARSDVKPKNRDPDSTEEIVSMVALFSPRWAAPEQIAGGMVGTYTDVYALGLVAAFMLTGVPLFDGKAVRATFAERIVGDNLIKTRLAQTGTPREAMPALLRALTARPEARVSSARVFYEQLTEALCEPEGSTASRSKHDSFVSISVEEEIKGAASGHVGERAVEVPPHEEMQFGERTIQLLDVDPLDLAVPTAKGFEARLRITLMFDRDGIRMNVKGLNCFMVRGKAMPTPAFVTKEDGVAQFVSSAREPLGQIVWSFGRPTEAGRAFGLDGREMVVPYTRATYAVALDVGRPHPVVVVCKR